MSKKRFPSPANVDVDKAGKPIKASTPKGPMPLKQVDGKPVDLVKVTHKGDYHIILHNSVHSLIPGDNYVDREIMAEAVKHPNIKALIESGKLIVGQDEADECKEDESEKEEQKEEES